MAIWVCNPNPDPDAQKIVLTLILTLTLTKIDLTLTLANRIQRKQYQRHLKRLRTVNNPWSVNITMPNHRRRTSSRPPRIFTTAFRHPTLPTFKHTATSPSETRITRSAAITSPSETHTRRITPDEPTKQPHSTTATHSTPITTAANSINTDAPHHHCRSHQVISYTHHSWPLQSHPQYPQSLCSYSHQSNMPMTSGKALTIAGKS